MGQSTNRDIEAAFAFHAATRHSFTSVRSGGHFLDWDNRPMPYKIYPGAGTIALPRELTLSSMPTLKALHNPQASVDTALDLESLTRLLFCADGLTRRANVGGEDYHFRAAASAGALYPVELYTAAGEIEGIEPGMYHFLPADLKLHGLRRGDWRPYLAQAAGDKPSIYTARAVLVMTSIFWRSTWKYRARGYRYCFWDTGTILANLLAAANAQGIHAEVITGFEDAAIEALLGLEGGREGITCIVALGQTAAASSASPAFDRLELEAIPLSPQEVVYDELLKIHRASRLTRDEVAEIARAQLQPRSVPASSAVIKPGVLGQDEGLGVGETILRRGSTRSFAREAISSEELATILGTAKLNIDADFPRLAETYVIVNAVDGVEPGAYYWNCESEALEQLKSGNFRQQAGYLCLEQPLGADCSALITYMTDWERTLGSLGNRGYRDAHLEAGLLGGRAYLAAYCLDRGATGLTFYDDDTTAFFQPHCGNLSPLLMVAAGVPRSRRDSGET